mmetsp:Transcript_69805/g.181701  ORF Transcript_69805/g.181701 Transcript_69805/m.181701 type:complete len:86 (-) Transcript_69805:559-816(-)
MRRLAGTSMGALGASTSARALGTSPARAPMAAGRSGGLALGRMGGVEGAGLAGDDDDDAAAIDTGSEGTKRGTWFAASLRMTRPF